MREQFNKAKDIYLFHHYKIIIIIISFITFQVLSLLYMSQKFFEKNKHSSNMH